jgi:hypothetical protein
MRADDTEVIETKEVTLNGRVVEVSLLKSYIYGTNKQRFTVIPRARYKELIKHKCSCCQNCINYKPR